MQESESDGLTLGGAADGSEAAWVTAIPLSGVGAHPPALWEQLMISTRLSAIWLVAAVGCWSCQTESITRSDRSTAVCNGLELAAAHNEAGLRSGVVISSDRLESICAHLLAQRYEVLDPSAIQERAEQRKRPSVFLELESVTILSPTRVRVLVERRTAWPKAAVAVPRVGPGPDAPGGTEVEISRSFGFWWRPKLLSG